MKLMILRSNLKKILLNKISIKNKEKERISKSKKMLKLSEHPLQNSSMENPLKTKSNFTHL